MTQTGGFAFLIAWGTFILLGGLLTYFILRRPAAGTPPRSRRRTAAPDERDEPDRDELHP